MIACKSLVTINVIYFVPGYHHIVNSFLFQTIDWKPRYPRVHRFLNFWHHEIDAVIKDVIICDVPYHDWNDDETYGSKSR